MKIEWLITNVTATRSPIRAESNVSTIFDASLPSWTAFVVWEQSGHLLLCPKTIPMIFLMKIKLLINDGIAVGVPARAESDMFWYFLSFFGKVVPHKWSGEPLCDLEIPF